MMPRFAGLPDDLDAGPDVGAHAVIMAFEALYDTGMSAPAVLDAVRRALPDLSDAGMGEAEAFALGIQEAARPDLRW